MITEVNKDNPYASSLLYAFIDGTFSLERKPVLYKESENDKLYTIKVEDTIWHISYKAYGNSRYYYIIMDANNIINPFELTPGDKLIIPDLKYILNIQP